MVGLRDISDRRKTVELGDMKMLVRGVSAQGISVLIDRFPEIRAAMGNRTGDLKGEDVLKMVPSVIGAIIVFGLAEDDGSERKFASVEARLEEEGHAANLPLGFQAELVKAIFDLTFPNGAGPFVELLRASGVLETSTNGSASAAISKVLGTKSPSPSGESSKTVTHQL